MNRRDRRARAAQVERAERNRNRIALLSVALFIQAKLGKFSRKEARRRLVAETVRRFGKFKARLMDPRLPSAKALEQASAQPSAPS